MQKCKVLKIAKMLVFPELFKADFADILNAVALR